MNAWKLMKEDLASAMERDPAARSRLTAYPHQLSGGQKQRVVIARALGLRRQTVDDLLVFHTAFGKTVADISFNAVANLGYAGCRFGELASLRTHRLDLAGRSPTVAESLSDVNGHLGLTQPKTAAARRQKNTSTAW